MIQAVLQGNCHLEENGTQNYLILQPMYKQFWKIGDTDYISVWKTKGLSDEVIKPPTTSDNIIAPALNYIDSKTRVKFVKGCLK